MTRPQVGDLIPLFKKVSAKAWVRPSDWLPLPTLTQGDQKFVGLHAVWPHDSNFCAFTVSGAYTVDWGDGSAPENNTSGSTAYHVFDYANLPPSSDCSRGYRQAIVTITPQTGQNLTSINLNVKHNQSGLNAYAQGWLDIRVVGSEITKCGWSSSTSVRRSMVEQFEFVGSNSITNFSSMFQNCSSLQSIPLLDTSSGTNFSSMFYSCYSLQSIPQLDISLGTDFSYMFQNCYSLQSIPQLDTSDCTDFSSMFHSCYSLQSIPLLDTSSGTNFSYMFYYCYSLQSIPQLDTSLGTDFSKMFYGCASLSCGTLSGTPITISYTSCRLSRQALVDIFNGLKSGVTGQTITITGNWGAQYLSAEDRAIATNKGWTITG